MLGLEQVDKTLKSGGIVGNKSIIKSDKAKEFSKFGHGNRQREFSDKGWSGRHSHIFDRIFISLSQIYERILAPTPAHQKNLHTPSFELLFTSHPPLSEFAELWPSPKCLPPPPVEELKTHPKVWLLNQGEQFSFLRL